MMNKTPSTFTSDPAQTVAALAHLGWCALVAIRLIQQEGQALTALTAHAFLLRWLATAQKQRRCPRSVASDIDALLILGRRKGIAANLHERMKYLWHSCSGHVEHQSDLFRLTYAIEALKAQGWENSTASVEEWQANNLQPLIPGNSALFVQKVELIHSFTDEGRLQDAVYFQVIGDASVFCSALSEQNLPVNIIQHLDDRCIIRLSA